MPRLLLFSSCVWALVAMPVTASVVIDAYAFNLNQFSGAAVTYRVGGGVAFAGKLWDNKVGVDGYTPGELAVVQAGGDPGDQITLQATTLGQHDWFKLTYGGAGIAIGGPGADTFVVYEITSSDSGFDPEATSWKISFNGGAFYDATAGISTFLDYSTQGVENVFQIAFNLLDFGFSEGNLLTSVHIENVYSGPGTSDPDFIFLGLEGLPEAEPGTATPEAASLATWALLGLAGCAWARRKSLLAGRR